jgi:hypothetical protein
LLYPTGSSIGIVMIVVGVGIWFGVQHLGYHEFAELGQAAKRTVDQKQIIVNNLAIRRATEELGSAKNFEQICQVLHDAFEGNEFDGFDLCFRPLHPEYALIPESFRKDFNGSFSFEWRKLGNTLNGTAPWELAVSLTSAGGQQAVLKVFRAHSARILFFDINLLTGEFQSVLAEAIDRALSAPTLMEEAAGVPVQALKSVAVSSSQ